jgi:hypothetical protein
MRPGLLLVVLALAPSVLAAPSTNNDDSCVIAVAPAATLLLPHFEVDLSAPPGEGRTTVLNIVNVSSYSQIARVTVWTDWAYPLLGFSVFLTGYDVQALDLRDFLVRGVVPAIVPAPGPISKPTFGNPNHAATVMNDCSRRMPLIPGKLMADIRSALTAGRFADSMLSCPNDEGQAQIGSDHGGKTAIGFVTVDVVSTCSQNLPNHAEYYRSDLLYDNVLIGDSVFIDPKGERNGHATASPMVHIRAVPEGGGAGSAVSTRLPRTFYGRFKPAVSDRRQPLPTTFAARYIEGGENGFRTQVTIWREGITGQNASCGDYRANASRRATEIVRFDERENATVHSARGSALQLAALSKIASHSPIFPARTSDDTGGWFFINLADSGQPTQNWIEVTLFAEGRYGAQLPAAAMSNGCAPTLPAGSRIAPR